MDIMLKFNIKCMKIYKNHINGMPETAALFNMHVAMNRVDPVVVHYLQMSVYAISLRNKKLS